MSELKTRRLQELINQNIVPYKFLIKMINETSDQVESDTRINIDNRIWDEVDSQVSQIGNLLSITLRDQRLIV